LGPDSTAKLLLARESTQTIQTLRTSHNAIVCQDCRSVDGLPLSCSECGNELDAHAEELSDELNAFNFVMNAFALKADGTPATH